ncbi:hypothetical protein ACFPTO_11830 [Paraburkholderia denitrificans]|uniref:ATP-binding protein n=1 Tax=Paraburkholderia denitrificans TaxID=694025 RepID=A0ABW0J8X3_9BURK
MAFNGKIAALTRKLRTSKVPHYDVFYYLRGVPSAELKRTLRDLRAALQDESIIFGVPFPKEFGELIDWTHLFKAEPARDLIVAAAELSLFANEINQFVSMQREFERSVLGKNYQKAETILANIERRFGVSLWLLESRIATLELYRGVEEQKRYMNLLLDDPTINPACKTLIYMLSVKAERNVTGERYMATLGGKVKFQSTRYIPAHYFYFHLSFYSLNQPDVDLHTVLLFERGSSIVDRYLTFVRICQLVVTGYSSDVSAGLTAALGFLENFNDYQLVNIRLAARRRCDKNYLPDERRERSAQQFLNILDLYTSGHYDELLNHQIDDVGDSELASLFDVAVRAYVRSSPPATGDFLNAFQLLVEPYSVVLEKSTSDATPYEQMLKIAQMFSKSGFSAGVYSKLLVELSDAGKRREWDIQAFAELNGSPFSPKLLNTYLDGTKTSQRSTVSPLIAKSLTYQFLRSVDFGEDDSSFDEARIPPARLLRYRALQAISKGNISEAEIGLRQVLSIGDLLDKQDAAVLIITALLNADRIGDATKETASILTDHTNWYPRIPLIGVLERIESAPRDQRRQLRQNLSVSVCYGLYSMFYGAEKDDIKTISVEEFLVETKTYRPSNIKNIDLKIPVRILIFFLYHVCKIDTLDSHIEYSSTLEVENERIRILLWLIEIDERQKSQYTDEIAAIAQKQLLRKGVETIDKSKIYVDVEGVKATISKDLSDLYLRFQSLPDHGGSNVSDIVLQLADTLSSAGGGLVKFRVPRNERLAALRDLYIAVRDRFVSSNEYGLDVYLSVGIRHGTLSGQLRSVFEAEHLVTQKDDKGNYVLNEYWLQELSLDETSRPREYATIRDLLCEFSAFADSHIGILRNSWIQIRTEDRNPTGLFDFRISNDEIVELNKRIESDMDVNEATDLMIQELWRKTDQSLTRIRTLLTSNFKSTFTQEIDARLASLSEVQKDADVQRLRNAFITARTTFQNEADDIAAWFTRGSKLSTTPYALSYAMDVALEMVKRCYPQRTLLLEQKLRVDPQLSGETLTGMVNVLFFAFDNIMEHCGSAANPEASLMCSVSAHSLLLVIDSNIYRDVNLNEENQRLSDLRSVIEKATTSDRVRREGGTGLLKIAKTIRTDFHSELGIEFGYQSEGVFRLSLNITGGKVFHEHSGD